MDENNKEEGAAKMKEPLNCWGYGEAHLLHDCPHRTVQNIQVLREATTANDISRNISRINATLEDHQDEHQSTIIEIEGMITE